jgi:phosphatidylinositol alpha-1,6-mannosyltransferase
MKILFLASDLSRIGGIQKYNQKFLEVLSEGQVVKVVQLKASSVFSKLKFTFKIIFNALFWGPDIIFSGHINFSPVCYFIRIFFGKRYVVTTHGIEVWDLKSAIKKVALKKARLVITISDYTKKELIRQMPEVANRIFILPNSIDGIEFSIKERSDSLFARHHISKNDKILLTVARLSTSEKYKGYDKVIRALPEILNEVPGVHYVLVGGGDDEERIRMLIKELSLEDKVTLAGRVSGKELVDYYNLCDVFVMPSKGEGFGIVFLEALACGKPVIAGNIDASREPLLNGELGLLIDPDDERRISQAIISVLERKVKPSLLDRNFLRRRVLEVYGFDKLRERVKMLLNELQR